MAFLDKMMKECALEFSDKGDMTIKQCHLYIGIIFDTIKGRMFIGKEKFQKTTQLLQELMQQAECSPRSMTKLQGKIWSSVQVHRRGHALPRSIQQVHQWMDAAEWDAEKVILHELRHTMGTLFKWLPPMQENGAEMWPLDPSTVLHFWEQDVETPGGPNIVVFWDSSPEGAAGISIRIKPDEIWKTAGI